MSVKITTLKISKNMDLKELALRIHNTYKDSEKVKFILDTSGSDITKDSIMKFKSVFDKFEKQAEKKLVETVIIVDGNWKKILLQSCTRFFKTNGILRIVDKNKEK